MEWIPTSVRMPSEQGQYLVTFPLCNGEPWVYILSFNKSKFYETDDEWGDVEYDDVTAWMPLPKPYTADTPQTDCPFKDVPCSCGKQDECEWHTELDTPQTEKSDSEYYLELADAVMRGEMSDAGANQAWYEYINKKDTPQTDCGWK